MPDLSEEDRFIERTGVYFESIGISQMSGRILGYLMISDDPLQSLTSIANRLQVAKSTASTAIRTLVYMTMVIKRGRPGSRMDYYELNPDMFKTALRSKVVAIKSFQEIIQQAYQLNHSDNDRKRLLNEMVYFYEFFLVEYPEIFERWEEYRKKLIDQGEL